MLGLALPSQGYPVCHRQLNPLAKEGVIRPPELGVWVLVVYFLGFQTGYENRSVIPRWDSHDILSLWWLLQGAISSSKRGKPNVAIMTCVLSAQIKKQCWPRVTLSLNPSWVTRMHLPWGAGDMLWVRGVLVDWDVHHDSGFSLMVSCIIWTRRRVGPSGICWTQEQWCQSPLRRWAGAFLIMESWATAEIWHRLAPGQSVIIHL